MFSIKEIRSHEVIREGIKVELMVLFMDIKCHFFEAVDSLKNRISMLILKICCKACKDTSLLTPEAQKIIEEAKEMGYLK